jgi:hypothetical protein
MTKEQKAEYRKHRHEMKQKKLDALKEKETALEDDLKDDSKKEKTNDKKVENRNKSKKVKSDKKKSDEDDWDI